MRNVFRIAYFVCILGITACAGQLTPTIQIDNSQAIDNSPTPLPLLTSSPLPPNTPPPLLTPDTPSPSPSPQLLQLTTNGCCVQPFWDINSDRLLFLDKPAPDAPTGIYQAFLEGRETALFTEKLGIYHLPLGLVAYPEGGQTYVERIESGERYTIPNGGRALTFSPNGGQVAWTAGESGPPFDTARREIWISNFDGTNPQQLLTLIGGGFSGWISEWELLVTGRQTPEETDSALWVFSRQDNSLRELVRGGRIRSICLAPGGAWVAYLVTFALDPAQNGLWIQNIVTGERVQLDLFGGYRWRDADHLLIIPLDPNAASGPVASHQLWEVDATTGDSRPLTDPALTPFKVAEGDWTVSPDGRYVAFVSATDRNIWVLTIQP